MHSDHEKSAAQWKTLLQSKNAEPLAFEITRQGATERPYTGKWVDHKEPGLYRCICCDAPMFASKAKFDSGSGWPSYFQAVDDAAIGTQADTQLGVTRTEIHCARCGAHLGHLFADGPAPTGLRYCVNSASLHFTDENTA